MLSVQYPEIPGGRGDRASSSGLTSQGRKECAGNGHSAACAGQWIFRELAIRVVRDDRAGGGGDEEGTVAKPTGTKRGGGCTQSAICEGKWIFGGELSPTSEHRSLLLDEI